MMRVVALVSGGKDSCYNMIQCVAAGHEIVALANLHPENKDELDSYMYQTVGHHGVGLYAEAMGLPLFRQIIKGTALEQGRIYTQTAEDEVEDLYQLLKTVTEEVAVEAVAVGAILSDYQRVRVESVCSRLGLISLAYLWRRDQSELLQEMIDCRLNAIIIKVASLGLDPGLHLGKTISEMQPHLQKMREKYGLNVCGEGGEYETFTLDCPLFAKSIVIDEQDTIIHSDDAIAPVGYINFKKMHLTDKEPVASMRERLSSVSVKTPEDYLCDLEESEPGPSAEKTDEKEEERETEETTTEINCQHIIVDNSIEFSESLEDSSLPDNPVTQRNSAGWIWVGNVFGSAEDAGKATTIALEKLESLLSTQDLLVSDLVALGLYISDMNQYASINAEYIKRFSLNPPVRICVQVPLPKESPILLEAVGFHASDEAVEDVRDDRHTMHVQGVSHWAPANIGPYSQAVRVGDFIYVAGQIALVPGTMQLYDGGVRKQCRLAVRHLERIVKAIDSKTELRDVVQGICYVTHPSHVVEAREEWEKKTNNAIVDYLVVPGLPRGALVEWQIWAHRHNTRFEYEETGYCIGEDIRVSIRRRRNYENNVSAIVCYVSRAAEEARKITEETLAEVLSYILCKLLHDAAPSLVCNFKVFYKIGVLRPQLIQNVFNHASGFSLVHTIIPVCHLHNGDTFLSVCGVRHE